MKKGMSTGGKVIIAAVLILTAFVAQHLIFNVAGFGDGRELVMTDTGAKVAYGLGADAQFYSFDSKNFYYCTKDGMQYIASDGTPVWKEIYSFTKPEMATAGEMVAVGEARGRHIYVFDADGAAYDVGTDYPVLTFSVNRTGTLSAVMQLDKGYAVHIYNRKNYAAPAARYVFQDELKIPVSSSVSEDGRFAAIAFWNLSEKYSSRVSFYYTNETDAWATEDGMFASHDTDAPEDQFVHTVRFMADNRALVFSDTEVTCFEIGEGNSCTQTWALPLTNEVDLLEFYSGNRFAVALGEKLLNQPAAAEPGTVNIYNTNGELAGTFALGRKATSVSMGHNALLVGADRGFYALKSTGEVLWNYRAITDIKSMFFLDNTDTVLMAGNADASVWKRMKEKAPKPPEDGLPVPPAGAEGNLPVEDFPAESLPTESPIAPPEIPSHEDLEEEEVEP